MGHLTYKIYEGGPPKPPCQHPAGHSHHILDVYNEVKDQVTKSVLLVDLTDGTGWYAVHEFAFYAIKNAPMHDKLIYSYPWEAPNERQMSEVVNIARIYGYNDVALFDASNAFQFKNITESVITECTHFSVPFPKLGDFKFTHLFNPVFIRNMHESWTFVSPEERKYKFVYLARNVRRNRIILGNEFFKRNLAQDSIFSCGWLCWNPHIYNKFIDPQYQHLFPVTLPEETEAHREYVNWEITDRIPTAVFNVIAETSYEPITEGNQECWQRKFHTEKTSKAYCMRQFPIWTSVMGFVQYQRDFRFDVFDDIIDHSYDKEFDPFKRIQMVADEIERLRNTYTLEQMQGLVAMHWHRLEHNKNMLTHQGLHHTQQFREKLTEWLLQ